MIPSWFMLHEVTTNRSSTKICPKCEESEKNSQRSTFKNHGLTAQDIFNKHNLTIEIKFTKLNNQFRAPTWHCFNAWTQPGLPRALPFLLANILLPPEQVWYFIFRYFTAPPKDTPSRLKVQVYDGLTLSRKQCLMWRISCRGTSNLKKLTLQH